MGMRSPACIRCSHCVRVWRCSCTWAKISTQGQGQAKKNATLPAILSALSCARSAGVSHQCISNSTAPTAKTDIHTDCTKARGTWLRAHCHKSRRAWAMFARVIKRCGAASVACNTQHFFAAGNALGNQAFAVFTHQHHAIGQRGAADISLRGAVVDLGAYGVGG